MIQVILDIDKLNQKLKTMISALWDSVESHTEKMSPEELNSFKKTHSNCLSDIERVMDNLDQVEGHVLSLNNLLCANEMRRVSNSVFVEESAKKSVFARDELSDSLILLSTEEFKKFATLIESK